MTSKQTAQISTPLMGILMSLSLCHFCNDALQAVLSSLYPMIKSDLALNFAQIGIVTLSYQMAASVFQPIMGLYLDKRPNPWFLIVACCFTFAGLAVLAFANTFATIIIAVVLVGLGSSIIHPEASRLTSLASAGRKGLAQSIFQVGGNLGGSFGPLLAAFLIAPYGRENTLLVSSLIIVGIAASVYVGLWYRKLLIANGMLGKGKAAKKIIHKNDTEWIPRHYSDKRTYFYIGVLLVLIFSKYVYMSSLFSYFTFYTIEKFGLDVQQSQYALFIFIFSTALGTLCGGPIGDKIGRKYVIWFSILGTAPFSLALPHLGLYGTVVMSFGAGFMLSSAFPAIVLMAQELLPNRIGMISGLFFGLAFGIAGIAAAYWGAFIESHGIIAVFNTSAWVPLLGLVAVLLPRR